MPADLAGKIEGGATGVLALPPAHPQASDEARKLRDVHTVDDIAFWRLEELKYRGKSLFLI